MERRGGELHPLTLDEIAQIPNIGERAVATYINQTNPSDIEIFHQPTKLSISPDEAKKINQKKRVHVPDIGARNVQTGEACWVEVTKSHRGRKKKEAAIAKQLGEEIIIIGAEDLRSIMAMVGFDTNYQVHETPPLRQLNQFISSPLVGD